MIVTSVIDLDHFGCVEEFVYCKVAKKYSDLDDGHRMTIEAVSNSAKGFWRLRNDFMEAFSVLN
jgi:hypothetical protein